MAITESSIARLACGALAGLGIVCGTLGMAWGGRGAAWGSEPAGPFATRVRVPPFPEQAGWINSPRPLDWADLRGKFVLLDFWTFGCINCMHMIPQLKKLEAAYPRQLVVVGVHSAKFESERDLDNLKEAVARYGLHHPVLNDTDFVLWKRFGVRAWPTLVLVDPEGYAVWARSGETDFEDLDRLIRRALPYYRNKGLLAEQPFAAAPAAPAATPLRFPGKLLADEAAARLFIADTGHHRIIATRLDGTLLSVIGAGTPGRDDGPFAAARFHFPQGMALAGDVLYVADTGNHLIRRVDLAAGRVTTIAGTGQQGRQRLGLRPLRASTTALSSPWALWLHDRWLYVAMAGVHQIWRLDPARGTIEAFAGDGREEIIDGPLRPPAAPGLAGPAGVVPGGSFAQPSGLASDGEWLYVADSEGSSIRAVSLDPAGEVRTLVGTAHLPAARLFTFGDVDGRGREVRLQHPLGIAWREGRLYVADTYNNKIKQLDPETGECRAIAGTGEPGQTDQPARFNEPAGLAVAGGKLYVADTNNHLIRVIDLAHGNRVSTLSIAGLEPPETDDDRDAPSGE